MCSKCELRSRRRTVDDSNTDSGPFQIQSDITRPVAARRLLQDSESKTAEDRWLAGYQHLKQPPDRQFEAVFDDQNSPSCKLLRILRSHGLQIQQHLFFPPGYSVYWRLVPVYKRTLVLLSSYSGSTVNRLAVVIPWQCLSGAKTASCSVPCVPWVKDA